MLLLFQCRKCGKFFCRSKHYTASVSNICCVKIITPCNINRQRILMIPCFIFYRNPEYACKHISRSPFNSFSFVLTFAMLRVKFLSYFDFSKILFSHTLYCPPPSFVYVRGFVDQSKIHPGITVSPFYGYGIPPGKSLDGDSDSPYPRTDIKDICRLSIKDSQLIYVCRFGRDCFFSRLFSDLHPRIRGDNGAEPKCQLEIDHFEWNFVSRT